MLFELMHTFVLFLFTKLIYKLVFTHTKIGPSEQIFFKKSLFLFHSDFLHLHQNVSIVIGFNNCKVGVFSGNLSGSTASSFQNTLFSKISSFGLKSQHLHNYDPSLFTFLFGKKITFGSKTSAFLSRS